VTRGVTTSLYGLNVNAKPGPQRPWSTSGLKRLGQRIRDDGVTSDLKAEYAEVMGWYNDLAAHVQSEIESLDFESLLGRNAVVEITSRAKTIDTLGEKLRRDRGMALPWIQDIAGVRVDASMTLSQQDRVAQAIAHHFGHDSKDIRDLRVTPHSGYRAVHVWLRLSGRVEVQVRTSLQSEWANTYESMADLFGRNIRYDELPADPEASAVVTSMRALSTGNLAGIERSVDALSPGQPPADFLMSLRQQALDHGLSPALIASIDNQPSAANVHAVLEGILTDLLRDFRYFLQQRARGEN
jgi:ppGpp synthetase/RelA/SpoT-type nucleotidyltranferase